MNGPETKAGGSAGGSANEPDGLTVTVELSCPKCGYSLYRRRIDQDCPECGQAVREALPKGEQIYFYHLDPSRPNPVFTLDNVTAAIAILLAMVLVYLLLAGMIEDASELALFSVVLVIQTIVMAVACARSNWKKSRRFVVILGEEEIWHTRDTKVMGKMKFRDIRKIRHCEGTGLAVIVVRALDQCDIPCTIGGYESLVRALEKAGPHRSISWGRWVFSDVCYALVVMFLFLLSVPALFGIFNWDRPAMLGALVAYYTMINCVIGYMTWGPTRSFDLKRTIVSLGPWMALLLLAVYRLVGSL